MTLTIEKLVQGGQGLAHLEDGKCIFLPGGLPGEIVECTSIKKSKDFETVKIDNIINKSEKRITPQCRYYDICGGCDFMHISAEDQLDFKQGILIENLNRNKVDLLNTEIFSPVPSECFSYRSRVRFHVKNGRIGFFKKNSKDLLELKECPVLTEKINSFLLNYNKNEILDGELPLMDVEEGIALDDKVYHIRVNNVSLPVTNKVFFQSNIKALEKLINFIIPFFDESPILDLYSGIGTFSAFLENNHKMIAVEQNKFCLQLAKMHLKNTKFYTAPVEKWHNNTDVYQAIVDPPRTGLAKNVPDLLKKWKIKTLVYVSCSSATFARDIKRLEKVGYKLKILRLFDFYPNTSHMETVAVLDYSSSK